MSLSFREFNKIRSRDIALRNDLVTANKKDSVGICFVGEKNLKDFLSRFIEFKKGDIKDENDNIIGQHQGSILYTQGQRQGLMIGVLRAKKNFHGMYIKKIYQKMKYMFAKVEITNY